MTSLRLVIISAVVAANAPAHAQDGSMKDMVMEKPAVHGAQAAIHKATGTVKSIDAQNGKVTLAHGPVETLNWPAMTMAFGVKDKNLLSKLSVGSHVQVEFAKQGNGYVIISVK